MRDLKATLEKFCRYFGLNYEVIVDTDYDDYQSYCIADYVIAYSKASETYYLQKVITYPGSYYDPPSQDFKDIIGSKRLDAIIMAMVDLRAKEALDYAMLDDEAF